MTIQAAALNRMKTLIQYKLNSEQIAERFESDLDNRNRIARFVARYLKAVHTEQDYEDFKLLMTVAELDTYGL